MQIYRKGRRRSREAPHGEHTHIVRGNPIRTYEGERFVLKNIGNDMAVLKRMRYLRSDIL